MRTLVKFAGLMALGLFGAVLWLGLSTGFDANGKALVSGRHGLDLGSYAAGLAAGIVLTTTFRFGLAAFVRGFFNRILAAVPGFRLVALAAIFGAILVYY